MKIPMVRSPIFQVILPMNFKVKPDREPGMDQEERRQFLLRELLQENARYRDIGIPAGEEEQKQLLRGLMNVRLPRKIDRKSVV